MLHDRLPDNELPVTQECASRMVGARRSSISVIAAKMRQQGLIDYRRGYINVLDRKGLEQTACECYPVLWRLYHELVSKVIEHA
jgi:hypothetical protein